MNNKLNKNIIDSLANLFSSGLRKIAKQQKDHSKTWDVKAIAERKGEEIH